MKINLAGLLFLVLCQCVSASPVPSQEISIYEWGKLIPEKEDVHIEDKTT